MSEEKKFYASVPDEAPSWEKLLEACGLKRDTRPFASSVSYVPVDPYPKNEWTESPEIRVRLEIYAMESANWVFECDDPEKLARFKAIAFGEESE